MLVKPVLDDAEITDCLRDQYALRASRLAFLPLGADQGTAVYRADDADGAAYFVKLRRQPFDELSVAVPQVLADEGVPHIIAPIRSQTGQAWTTLDDFALMLYPYVEGLDGYQTRILERHWRVIGATTRAIHSASLPSSIQHRIRREQYSPQARLDTRSFVARAERETYSEPVAAQAAALLRAERARILDLIERAETLAVAVAERSLPLVLCHSDLHAGNFLITPEQAIYIVDWDEVILAPRERDLMFIGSGVCGEWFPPAEEERLFYQGYGATEVDQAALAYYRYDRIVQDIAAFSEQILLTNEGGEDRAQSLQYLTSNFAPGGVVEIAYRLDRTR